MSKFKHALYKAYSLLIALMLFSAVSVSQAAESVERLLEQADRFRIPGGDVVVEVEILQFKGGVEKKRRDYSVYLKPGRRSLVLFRHPSERGQKVLMVDEKFWMVMPGSRRPIRITPMQKLLGEASTGDIATLTWSEDYRGKIVQQSDEEIELLLEATGAGSSYAKIDLFLHPQHHYPLRANLYLASGKLAKQARYQLGELDGVERIVGMVLEDRLSSKTRTEVNYRAIRSQAVDQRLFNPMYLVRNRTELAQ